MGTILYRLTINMEEDLIKEILSTELDNYINRYAQDSNTPPPSGVHIQIYVIGKDASKLHLPLQLQQLPLGLSHIIIDDSGYYVESRENNKTRFLVLYADKQIKLRKSQHLGFLALGITLMTLLSGILGRWLAGQIIAPVGKLTHLVSKLKPDFKPLLLTDNLPRNEIGKLTRAIYDYQQRLAAFNERERAFSCDISHELRTPITIIQGVVEVMLTQPDLTRSRRKKLNRIARAATQMTHLTTALLALAREESDDDSRQHYSVESILIQVIDEHQYLLNHKAVKVKLDTNSHLTTSANPILLYVILANLIRNAFSYTHQGAIHIHMQEQQVLIKDTGAGIHANQLIKMFEHGDTTTPSRDGHGIGLSLVWRICKRYNWNISVHSQKGRGTSVELLFATP
jgi:signal transduction histidine kinase